jgi:hypothetical protein
MNNLKVQQYLFIIFIVGVLPFLTQTVAADEYTITNTETGLALDVNGGNDTVGTPVWLFNINSTRAQAFEIQTEGGVSKILPKTGPNLALEAQSAENVVSTGGSFSPTVTQRAIIESDNSGPLGGLVLHPATQRPKFQQWRLVPVTGEVGTVQITNLAYGDSKVLAPLAAGSNSLVKMVDVSNASRTHWKVERLNPNRPTGVRLQSIKYKDGKVKGSLFWNDESTGEEKFRVSILRASDGVTLFQDVAANTENLEFSFDFDADSKNKRHCLTVSSIRQHYRTFEGLSNPACGTAYTRNVGQCGPWFATIEISANGVLAEGGQSEPPTGCVVDSSQNIRIRKHKKWWWDETIASASVNDAGELQVFYECKPRENVGTVFAEIKVGGNSVAKSPKTSSLFDCG